MYTGGWSDFAEMKAHAFRRHKEQYRMQKKRNVIVCLNLSVSKVWVIRVKARVAPDHDKLTSNFKKERAVRKFDGAATALQEREKRLMLSSAHSSVRHLILFSKQIRIRTRVFHSKNWSLAIPREHQKRSLS